MLPASGQASRAILKADSSFASIDGLTMMRARRPDTIGTAVPDRLLPIHAEMRRIANDPTASSWLRNAITECRCRDPVDAFNDVTLLKDLLELRLEALFAAAKHPP